MKIPNYYKNISFPIKIQITGEAEYMPGKAVSKILAQNDAVSVTLFAFEKAGKSDDSGLILY